MRSIGRCLVIALSVMWFSGAAYAGSTAGVFRLPYNPAQQWNVQGCTNVGFTDINPNGLVFMELNTTLSSGSKYHLGEDWNGVCGGSTDKGADLNAIADGVVENADMIGPSGGWLLIKHLLPDTTSRYVLYEHILDIAINPRTGQPFKITDAVYRGEVVAHIGNGNGAWGYHLHFEMRRDNSLTLKQNPYYQPLKVTEAMKYTSPSLFIDDRRYPFIQPLTNSAWTYIGWNYNAPSSTAFIEYNGERYSLKRAVQLGYIYQYVYEQRSGLWYYYPDIANVFFSAGNTYAVWSFVSGAMLNILVPGNNYKDDRAKIDMIRAVSADRNFINVEPDVYVKYYSDQWYDYYYMKFIYNNGSGNQIVYANHATSKSNPLIRYTTYYDPVASQWMIWRQVNQNTLD